MAATADGRLETTELWFAHLRQAEIRTHPITSPAPSAGLVHLRVGFSQGGLASFGTQPGSARANCPSCSGAAGLLLWWGGGGGGADRVFKCIFMILV